MSFEVRLIALSNLIPANTVLMKLKQLSQEQNIEPPPAHHFIKADLSLISEAKRVAEDIRVRSGAQGIDYLILSQGVRSLRIF